MIDYELLGHAQHFYSGRGHQYVEVPWRVTPEIIGITHKVTYEDQQNYSVGDKMLIGSGEQGFLYLWAKGYLPPGKYQTITPCFRKDPHDLTHTKQFMKLELFDNTYTENAKEIMDAAMAFFNTVAQNNLQLDNGHFISIPTQGVPNLDVPNTTYDIECEGIEMGSYGVRKCQLGKWVYGTGIAEPRFSRTLKSLTK